MKIARIEQYQITVPLAERYDNPAGRLRMYDIDQHIFVKVIADNGLVGYGGYEDANDPIPEATVDQVVGRSPFDFLMNNLPMALGMALYDLMGKHLEVPVYKLMGRKVRDRVAVAAWTRPCPPRFRGGNSASGGPGLPVKMHSDTRWDVLEHTRAAERVAPPGFKLHWDLNHSRTIGTILPIVAEMERNHPIVGFIEDPLRWEDIEGLRRLREKTTIPVIMHIPQLGGLQEVIRGVADIYMIGGSIGNTLESGFAYGKANVQCLIQQTGSTLMKALTLHQAAVFPTASVHTINADDQFDDPIAEAIPVIEGASTVPEEPGLGVEVDEKALADAIDRAHLPEPDFIGRLRLPSGNTIFTRGNPDVNRLTGLEEGAIAGIDFEHWEDDGTTEFQRVSERLEREDSFIEET